MPSFVFKSDPTRGRVWAEVFRAQAPEIDFRIWPDIGDPAAVHYLAAWVPPPDLVTQFPNLRLLMATSAGVDQFDLAALPPALPLVRMIEPGIVAGMVEYVVHAVLDLHRDMPAYRRQQQQGLWAPLPVRPAAERRVGVLGLGSLGQAVLAALRPFSFDALGWSRSQQPLPLDDFLARSDVLVCLLPLTAKTRGFLNAERLARLPPGAGLVHVGRGAQLVLPDLLAALDRGALSEAVLDVTEPEPLPADHPLWLHPRVRLTPHIASMTQPASAALVALDNLRRFQAGQPLHGLVDRLRGY